MKKYLAELIGTFALVFCGTGAIVINQETGGAIGHAGIAMTFGLVVMSMIYTFGDISGAQLNPAVTIGFALSGRFEKKEVAPYIGSQIAGAFLASFVLKMMFPQNATLGATLPAGAATQSFVLEVILSYLLMLVILNVSQGSKETGLFAGIAIGGTVLLEAMFAGPICGASMNPARSLSPALVSGNLTDLWVYLTAPVMGVVLAVFSWKFLDKGD
ncbi:MAG: aquaporin [Saprospiraceae bacterium]|nr:aquaporin [Saprospiraceae bacterium]